jgi:hypothetical protein
MTNKQVTITDEVREEYTRLMNDTVQQMISDAKDDSWKETLDDGNGLKAFETVVPNHSIKKVKGTSIISTKLSPQQFIHHIDSIVFFLAY